MQEKVELIVKAIITIKEVKSDSKILTNNIFLNIAVSILDTLDFIKNMIVINKAITKAQPTIYPLDINITTLTWIYYTIQGTKWKEPKKLF